MRLGREYSLHKFKKELDLTPSQTQEFERSSTTS
jgi:hypothetical protein